MPSNIGSQLLDVPFDEMVKSLAGAIASAQFDLDKSGVRLTQMMAGVAYETGELDEDGRPLTAGPVRVKFGDESLTMLELGFTPTFYQFVDTIIEVKISINITTETRSSTTSLSASGSGSYNPFIATVKASASAVSASFSQKYNYSAEGSSLIRTKLVPVPPPAILEERIRALSSPAQEATPGGGT